MLVDLLLSSMGSTLRAAHLDERLPRIDAIGAPLITRVRPTLMSRLMAEWRLRSLSKQDILLSLGNMPPLFGTRAKTYVFLQNRLLIDGTSLTSYAWRTRLRMTAERWWLKWRLTADVQLVVQTRSMATLAASALGVKPWVLPMAPFVPKPPAPLDAVLFDFIYVASGETHKNHRRLVEAWRLLCESDLRPSLLLTVSKKADPGLYAWISEQAALYDLQIELRGDLVHAELLRLYTQSRCKIYPSLLESYGLPLVEATAMGLPIIASERDFVRDVCSPRETFDPESALSIARAVRRFLGTAEQLPATLTAEQFLDQLRAGHVS